MTKDHVKRKGEEIGLRARAQARRLVGRPATLNGQLFLVHGHPQFDTFYQTLVRLAQSEPSSCFSDFEEFGFPRQQISLVSRDSLATSGRALQKWQKIIGEQKAQRNKKTDLRRRLEGWVLELDGLEARLSSLLQWQSVLESKTLLPEGPFLLLPHEAARWNVLSEDYREILALDARWQTLAKTTFWLGGTIAAERFLDILAEYIRSPQILDTREALEALHLLLRRHRKIAQKGTVGLERSFSSIAELAPRLPGILSEWVSNLQSDKESLNCRLQETLNVLTLFPETPSLKPVSKLAAFFACTSSSTFTPFVELLPICSSSVLRRRPLENLVQAAALPGFGQLMAFLAEYDEFLEGYNNIESIQKLLASGSSNKDIRWLITNGCSYSLFSFAEKKLSPKPVRQLVEALQGHGKALSQSHIREFVHKVVIVHKVVKGADLRFLEALIQWVKKLRGDILTPPMISTLCSVVALMCAQTRIGVKLRPLLDRWTFPPPEQQGMPNCPAKLAEDDTIRRSLSLLAYYQQLSGLEPGMTNSIKALLPDESASNKEILFLKRLDLEGQLSPEMRKRLNSLSTRDATLNDKTRRKLLKQVERVCAVQALAALKNIIDQSWRSQWKTTMGCDPDIILSSEDAIDMISWAMSLDKNYSAVLKKILSLRAKLGKRYKEGLSENLTWTKHFDEAGGRSEEWLYPEAEWFELDGRKLCLEVCCDPLRVFLMGSRFNTCLSLGDGCNRDAVLANACDVNKAVLYVCAEDGSVVARKLVCITHEMGMIGFVIYDAFAERAQLESVIHRFCGRWASRSRVQLKNFGAPENLCGLFWYDDGLAPWIAEAYASENAYASPRCFHEDMSRALIENEAACCALLESLNLEMPPFLENHVDWQTVPGLAEELLGIVSRLQGDAILAERLFDHAFTQGGRLEALTALVEIKREGVFAEAVQYGLGLPGFYPRLASCLVEVGSEEAIRILVKLAAEGEISWLWLPFALTRLSATAGLVPRLMSNVIDSHGIDRFLCVASLAEQITGELLPDNVLARVFISAGNQSSEAAYFYWSPCLNKPEQYLSFQTFESIYRLGSLPVALVAARNPCSEAHRFLLEFSSKDPFLLIPLAFNAPRKYKKFIEKQILENPGSFPTIIALFETHGVDRAEALLSALPAFSLNICKTLNCAKTLYAKCQSRDWLAINSTDVSSCKEGLDVCEFLTMTRLWSEGSLSLATFNDLTRNHVFKRLQPELAIMATKIIRSSDELDSASFASAVCNMNITSLWEWFGYDLTDFILYLNLAAGMTVRVPEASVASTLPSTKDCDDAIIASMFFDQNDCLRSFAHGDWYRPYGRFPVSPVDPFDMDRLAAFYTLHTTVDLSDTFYHQPPVLMRRLLNKYAKDETCARRRLNGGKPSS